MHNTTAAKVQMGDRIMTGGIEGTVLAYPNLVDSLAFFVLIDDDGNYHQEVMKADALVVKIR